MQKTITSCEICFHKYNTDEKKPIIVCQQDHSMCMECLQNLTVPFFCPFCRKNIAKDNVKLDLSTYQSLGGSRENILTFRYLYYRDQLRLMPQHNLNIIPQNSLQALKVQSQQALITAKNILKVLTMVFIIFTIMNLIPHLCLVFTEQQQCIDWDQHPHTYTIREYLKLNILINIACFSIAAGLYTSQNANIKGFVELYGEKLVGIYIAARLLSEIWMWSHFMFVMQPQCSSFTYLYLHIETFGYYLFMFLFTMAFAYYYIRRQKLAAFSQ